MRTNVSHASLVAWDSIQCELEPKQRMILSQMARGRIYSRRQLAQMTRLETSCVAGRMAELVDQGLVEVVGFIRCPITQRQVEGLKLPDTQIDIFQRLA